MLIRLLVLVLCLAACEEDEGPNSQHCIEVRMRWLELDYLRKSANDAGDVALARQRALLGDLVVSADTKCFPGFVLR